MTGAQPPRPSAGRKFKASTPRLCLERPITGDASRHLLAAASSGPLASVVLTASIGIETGAVSADVQAAQALGIAALIRDDARLARVVKADGVHLGPGPDVAKRMEEARGIIGGRAILGVDAGGSRHDAMTAGEAADYVAFGPLEGDAGHRRLAELIAWWAEIFEPPVVALGVEGPETATVLAEAGADFVSVAARAGESAEALASRIAAIRRAIEKA